jgi:hypothetical protein
MSENAIDSENISKPTDTAKPKGARKTAVRVKPKKALLPFFMARQKSTASATSRLSQQLVWDVTQAGLKRPPVCVVHGELRWFPRYAPLSVHTVVQPGHIVHGLMRRDLRVANSSELPQGPTISIRWKFVELRARLVRSRARHTTVVGLDRWTGHIRGDVRTGDIVDKMEDQILVAVGRGRCHGSNIGHGRIRGRKQEIAEDVSQMVHDQRHQLGRISMIHKRNGNLRH